MEFAFVVIAFAALAQCVALLAAISNGRYWRERYFEVSKQRDEVIEKWNKTIDESKEFRERVQKHLSVVE